METNTNKELGTNDPEAPKTDDAIPENAFLIIDGVRIRPLKETVVNIGRRLENDVIIDDPRISRQHAQLRAIHGHYVLFDLHSTGGTFVNGQRTTQTVIYPGDMISLAGVILIFGQDTPPTDLVDASALVEPESGEPDAATAERSTVDIEAVSKESRTHSASSDPDGDTIDKK